MRSAILLSQPYGPFAFRLRLSPGRQLLPAAHCRRARHLGPLMIDFPLTPACQYFFESNTALETSEAGAEAEVEAMAEAQVMDARARHVETIGVLELALVSVCRAV